MGTADGAAACGQHAEGDSAGGERALSVGAGEGSAVGSADGTAAPRAVNRLADGAALTGRRRVRGAGARGAGGRFRGELRGRCGRRRERRRLRGAGRTGGGDGAGQGGRSFRRHRSRRVGRVRGRQRRGRSAGHCTKVHALASRACGLHAHPPTALQRARRWARRRAARWETPLALRSGLWRSVSIHCAHSAEPHRRTAARWALRWVRPMARWWATVTAPRTARRRAQDCTAHS